MKNFKIALSILFAGTLSAQITQAETATCPIDAYNQSQYEKQQGIKKETRTKSTTGSKQSYTAQDDTEKIDLNDETSEL